MIKEPLIDSAVHLRHIFSRLLLAEKLDVHPVHLAFFAIAEERICTESVPPHSISVSINNLLQGIASIFIAIVLLLMIAPGIVLNIIALNKLSHAACKTDISTGLSICVLIFGSLLGGIFLLCLSDKDFMPTAAVNQTIYYQNVPPVQPTNGYFQGMPNGNSNTYQNPYQNGNPNAYQNPYQNGSPNAYQNAKPTTYPNGNQNTPQDPTPNPNADPAPNETGTTDNGSTKS